MENFSQHTEFSEAERLISLWESEGAVQNGLKRELIPRISLLPPSKIMRYLTSKINTVCDIRNFALFEMRFAGTDITF